jgi:hypothetical protein
MRPAYLARDADGSVRFKNSAVTPRLRVYLEQRRIEGERLNALYDERLFAENMAFLGVRAEPTRQVVHTVETKTRRSCGTWRAYSVT